MQTTLVIGQSTTEGQLGGGGSRTQLSSVRRLDLMTLGSEFNELRFRANTTTEAAALCAKPRLDSE